MNTTYRRYIDTCSKMARGYRENEFDGTNQMKGAIATKLIREEMGNLVGVEFTVSTENSFIEGSPYEYDLLVVRKDAMPSFGNVYRPEDVIAVVECKANGLFDPERDSSTIALAANAAYELNPSIRFGYISMTERMPEHEEKRNGKEPAKFWELTKAYLRRKLKMFSVLYAVTLAQGKDILDGGSDAEFHEFVDTLASVN